MAVRRDTLDALRCSHENHSGEACDASALYLHSRCHPDKPTWAVYADGVLRIECAKCKQAIVEIEVAGGMPPGGAVFRRRPE